MTSNLTTKQIAVLAAVLTGCETRAQISAKTGEPYLHNLTHALQERGVLVGIKAQGRVRYRIAKPALHAVLSICAAHVALGTEPVVTALAA